LAEQDPATTAAAATGLARAGLELAAPPADVSSPAGAAAADITLLLLLPGLPVMPGTALLLLLIS
jgi:hypothetical protein